MELNQLARVIWFYRAALIASLAGGGKLLNNLCCIDTWQDKSFRCFVQETDMGVQYVIVKCFCEAQ